MQVNKRQCSKPVLLVVTTTFPRWKNDTDPPFVYELAKRLTGDFDITVHTPHYPEATQQEIMGEIKVHRFRYFFERFEKIAGKTAILPFLRENRRYFFILPFFLFFQFASLVLLARKIKPDIIHAHWLIPSGFFAVCLVMFGCNVPIIVTCHGADILGLQSRIFKFIKKITLARIQGVTVVSNALKEELLKLTGPGKLIEIIPMGVDSELFCRTRYLQNLCAYQRTGTSLLYVGRLTEKKGVRYLLEGTRKVLDRGHNVSLIIVGDGEQKESLQALTNNLGIGSSVKFIGAIPNTELPELYALADIFVGPSIATVDGDSEGFGLTFVEASMSGCFLIGTMTGGIVDIIEDGISGLLAKPGNSEDLADKIAWAIDNPQLVEKCKKVSLEKNVKNYDWTVISNRYLNMFLSFI